MYQLGQGFRYKDSEGHIAVAKFIFHIYIGGVPAGIEDPLQVPLYGERNNAVYNLNGQRMNTLQKGLNIVGGKKVWVR